MKNEQNSDYIKLYFGKEIFGKFKDIPDDSIKILEKIKDPIKIRALIFERGNLYHLIIDDKNKIIYHDCPSFLMNETFEGNYCLHIIMLLFMLEKDIYSKIIRDLSKYSQKINDDFYLEKNHNYMSLLNLFKDSDTFLDAINFLKKSNVDIANNGEVGEYLAFLIEHHYYLEFFNLLGIYSKNILFHIFEQNDTLIADVVSKFFKVIPQYSFLYLLRIIDSIEQFFYIFGANQYKFHKVFIKELKSMSTSSNFNQNYFMFYFSKLILTRNISVDPFFNRVINNKKFDKFKGQALDAYLDKINDFCIVEYLDYMKKHMKFFQINEELYRTEYNTYKNELNQLELRFYLRKFAFLKIFIKKNSIKKSKFEVKRINDKFIVQHDQDNLKNKFYTDYLLPHLGFYGEKKNIIKARNIGRNFYLFNKLFIAEWEMYPSVMYFNKKFWGNVSSEVFKSNQSLALLRHGVDYIHDAGIEFPNIDDIMIIEWDLANVPFNGTSVNAYGTHLMVPDYKHHLFFDLKPFDLCYCRKKPKEIEDNNIKIIEVISKCSFKDAIMSVSKGMSFIEGLYPLSLVSRVKDKEISPFKAIEILEDSPKKQFVPHFYQFIFEFKEFMFNSVFKENDFVFDEQQKYSDKEIEIILSLLGISNYLAGIQIPYKLIINSLINTKMNRDTLRVKLISTTHEFIKEILEKKEIGSTHMFDLDKIRNTPFSRYSLEILKIRKDEFENLFIYRFDENGDFTYNLANVARSYYGAKILDTLEIKGTFKISNNSFRKFKEISSKLGLKVNIVDSSNN